MCACDVESVHHCIMNSRQSFCSCVLLVIVHLFDILDASLNCPSGCSCQNEVIVCNGTSSFPDLSLTSSNFSTLEFWNCHFAGGILPAVPESYSDLNITSMSFINCIKTVDFDAFVSLQYLEYLTITGSHSLNLKSSAPLETLKSLRHLNLSSNELTSLPVGLCDVTPLLRVVDVSHNHLTNISDTTFRGCWTSLADVKLQDNDFQTLSYESLPWFYLFYANLNDNPWNCDCAMQWVKDIDPSMFVGSSCSLPANYAGKGLFETESKIHCGLGNSRIALGIAIPILIVCLVVVGYFLFKILRSHRSRKRNHTSVKYSSVYEDTVESGSKLSSKA